MDEKLLINGNIPKSYFRLTLPNVLSMVITLVYNLADTYFIAAVGNTDLVAGVSLCAPVLTIQMAFGNVFAQGGCSLTSRLLGAAKKDDVKHVSAHCIYAGYLLGLILGVFFLLAGNILLPLLGQTMIPLDLLLSIFTGLQRVLPLLWRLMCIRTCSVQKGCRKRRCLAAV